MCSRKDSDPKEFNRELWLAIVLAKNYRPYRVSAFSTRLRSKLCARRISR